MKVEHLDALGDLRLEELVAVRLGLGGEGQRGPLVGFGHLLGRHRAVPPLASPVAPGDGALAMPTMYMAVIPISRCPATVHLRVRAGLESRDVQRRRLPGRQLGRLDGCAGRVEGERVRRSVVPHGDGDRHTRRGVDHARSDLKLGQRDVERRSAL